MTLTNLNLKSFDRIYPILIQKYNTLVEDPNANVLDKINQIIDSLNSMGKLSNDVVNNWNNVMAWTMNDGLTTDVSNKLNTMVADGTFDSIFQKDIAPSLGDLTTLQTMDKSNLTNALNEVDNLAKSNQTNLGNLANLTTSDKTNLVNAVNSNVASLAEIVHLAPLPSGGDDTQALKNFFTLGYTNIKLVGTYQITLTQGQSLCSFTNINNIKIDGHNATIMDNTVYSYQGATTPMFLFTNCQNIEVDVNYQGLTIPTPTTNLGYLGGTVVQFSTGSQNIKIRGQWSNARYGILAGDYTTVSMGYNKHFDIDIMTNFVGYAQAHYLSENVNARIVATNNHRATYLGGVVDANIHARFQNQYIAQVQVLLTDSTTGTGTSRGCSNVKVKAIDMGSTVFPSGISTFCTGISLSRVDPNTTFDNNEFEVYLTGTNTIATTVGAFIINSSAKNQSPSYTYNWDSTIAIRNTKLKGFINRSAQTVNDAPNGDIYISTTDTVSAQISNFNIDDLVVIPCTTPHYYLMDFTGLKDSAQVKGLKAPGVNITLNSNLNSTINILQSQFGVLTANGNYNCKDSIISDVSSPDTYGSFINTSVRNSKIGFKMVKRELTLSGATVTFSNMIPYGGLLLDVHTLVTQAITGSTNYNVGITGTTGLFVSGAGVSAGTKTQATAGNGSALNPKLYSAWTDIVVTGNAAFTGGSLLVMVWYLELIRPS